MAESGLLRWTQDPVSAEPQRYEGSNANEEVAETPSPGAVN